MHLATPIRQLILLFTILIPFSSFGINPDSLLNIVAKTKSDTLKVNLMNRAADEYLHTNSDKCAPLLHHSIALAKKINHQRGLGVAYQVLGNYFSFNATDSSLFYLLKAKEIKQQTNDIGGLASVAVNIGSYYEGTSEFPKALNCYLEGLTLFEKINYEPGIASASMGAGNVFLELFNQKKAIDYYKKSLFHYQKLNSPYQSWVINNMATAYERLGNVDTAEVLYQKSLAFKLDAQDYYGAVFSINSLGNMFMAQKSYKKALRYFERAQMICREKNLEKEITAHAFKNLTNVYIQLKDAGKAKTNMDSLEKLSDLLKLGDISLGLHLTKSSYYEMTGDYRMANYYKGIYLRQKDSTLSDEVKRITAEADAKFKTEKKQKEIELLNKDKEISDLQLRENKTELNKQRAIILSSVGAGILLVIMVFLLFNRNKLKQKTNEKLAAFNSELQIQKHLVEEKQKEILDSIKYAKHLQEAILPNEQSIKNELQKNGSDYFILYKPKDIVAGDFYFFEKKDDTLFFAAADCTGHGVPGALVSVVCSTALNRSVLEFNLSDSAQILNKTRELVLDTFSKSESIVKDGMDISFCSLSLSSLALNWAGANNPLWFFRKQGESYVFTEIKPDKQPIGKTENPVPFTRHELALGKGDIVYLFTDGFADQFGGEKARLNGFQFGQGKKFKYKQLQELMSSCCHLSMNEQKAILNKHFDDWKGQLEQVDDVCIIGIRL
jgi:serine phosphatase RsbU (regulator of sigma subunit)